MGSEVVSALVNEIDVKLSLNLRENNRGAAYYLLKPLSETELNYLSDRYGAYTIEQKRENGKLYLDVSLKE